MINHTTSILLSYHSLNDDNIETLNHFKPLLKMNIDVIFEAMTYSHGNSLCEFNDDGSFNENSNVLLSGIFWFEHLDTNRAGQNIGGMGITCDNNGYAFGYGLGLSKNNGM